MPTRNGNSLETLTKSYKTLCMLTSDPAKRRRRRKIRRSKAETQPNTSTMKKTNFEPSIVKNGQIYCINHTENSTPYWGGSKCDTYIDHDGEISRFVCSTCVAKLVPPPPAKPEPTLDPVTGEKRKRGRPKGSKNKSKSNIA